MKKLLLLAFILGLFSLTISAQNFCVKGATWWYGYWDMIPTDGYTRLSFEKDTIINNKSCDKISGTTRYSYESQESQSYSRYFFLSGDTMYVLKNSDFFPVCFFNCKKGDTFSIRNFDCYITDSIIRFVVDTTGTMDVNGQQLRFYNATAFDLKDYWLQQYVPNINAIERMGIVNNDFFPAFSCGTDGHGFSFRCYKDSSLSVYNRNSNVACDFVSSIKNEKFPQGLNWQWIEDNLLQVFSESDGVLEIFNLQGQKVLENNYNSGITQHRVNISRGFYLIRSGNKIEKKFKQ